MICGNPLSRSPPCQAAGGVADQDAGAAVDAAVSDIAQNFAPTPAFPQLSSTPATITALHFKYLSILNISNVIQWQILAELWILRTQSRSTWWHTWSGTVLQSTRLCSMVYGVTGIFY